MRWISLFLLVVLTASGFVLSQSSDKSPKVVFQIFGHPRISDYDSLDNMPIVEDNYEINLAPIEQRGAEFRKFLAPSVKIAVSNGSGSGTICYYERKTNTAYIASCGHLWDRGLMPVEEGKKKNITCKIITWYHNNVKLDQPKEYPAKVIFYSNRSGCDTSLVTFEPDWVPTYFPIAPVNKEIKPGSRQHSCGCDGGREVAHYDVKIIGIQGADLLTTENSPRPGRSGGGLLSDDGYYIGTCWGTSVRDGTGTGYFTPLSVIHNFWNQQSGYEWLLKQKPGGSGAARQLPIINRNNPPEKFPEDYIPLPN